MLTFSVCPHDTQKGLERWFAFKEKLEKLVGKSISFQPLKSHEEEYKKLEEGEFFDLYYAGPLVSLPLYKKGYKPVAKFKGQRDIFFLVSGTIPNTGEIRVSVPFLKPAVMGIMGADISRVFVVYTKNFVEAFELLKRGDVHACVMYNDTWEQISEEEKKGFKVLGYEFFETSHLFMVKPEYYEKLKDVLLSFEELEPAGDEDIKKIEKLYKDFDNFTRLWSYAGIANALKGAEHIGVVVYSDRVLDVNQAFCKMVGYEREELLGKDIYTFVAQTLLGKDAEKIKADISKVLKGEYFSSYYLYFLLPALL